MPAPTTDAEVLIVGAGPVGLFTALRLGQAGISVAVLERDDHLSQLPRACMFYPQVQFALDQAEVYNDLIEEGGGFRTTGLDIRLPPASNSNGGKEPGQLVANFPREDAAEFNPKGPPRAPMDGTPAISMLNIPQSQMCQVLMNKAVGTGHVRVLFSKELVSIESDGSGEGNPNVSIRVQDLVSNTESQYTASFLIGADGGRSKTRSLLGIPFPGHTWPEKLVATDVWLPNEDGGPATTTLLMDSVHYTVLSPLTPPILGEVSKWRVTFALNPEELKTKDDEDFLTEGYIAQHYDRVWVGPRPLSYKIDRKAIYTVHQRLAANLKKGRCLLAGDAAHVNNVIGGLGLSNCLLDSVALSDALVMILREGKPADPVLTMYSDERRQVFQFFVDPVSSWSKLRIQSGEADDWFFRSLNDTSSPSFARYIDTLENFWPTHIRDTAKLLAT
ncbi:putative FAD binding domain protein [Rosellinia necatrix]|uniref:Putative FAD binding domain protein n=1 Tax=Rosellinia necatrix TaxID=77044 RepID=A0A1W2TBC0_ROSNE|nr:putative FAD binding domain protein [Rosellinia necatrix]